MTTHDEQPQAEQPMTVEVDDAMLLAIYVNGFISGVASGLVSITHAPTALSTEIGLRMGQNVMADPAARTEVLEAIHGRLRSGNTRHRAVTHTTCMDLFGRGGQS